MLFQDSLDTDAKYSSSSTGNSFSKESEDLVNHLRKQYNEFMNKQEFFNAAKVAEMVCNLSATTSTSDKDFHNQRLSPSPQLNRSPIPGTKPSHYQSFSNLPKTTQCIAHDVYRLAKAYFCSGEFNRAIQVLQNYASLLESSRACRFLVARAHMACKDWDTALEYVSNAAESDSGAPTITIDVVQDGEDEGDFDQVNIKSSQALLRGKIYMAKKRKNMAISSFKEALQLNIHNYEAFDQLSTNHLLTQREEKILFESLPWHRVESKLEEKLLRLYYQGMVKKYGTKVECLDRIFPKDGSLDSMRNNLDVRVSYADSLYNNLCFQSAFQVTKKVLELDLDHERALFLHIGCLVEMENCNELFIYASRLVESYPTKALAWYTIACYYYVVNNQDQARKYFSKASEMEQLVGESLIGFGNSFAADGEHDHALIAYCSASRSLTGCHLPQLYIGMEYVVAKEYELAIKCFKIAYEMCPNDPLITHEIGVVCFKMGDYGKACHYFDMCLELCDEMDMVDSHLSEIVHTTYCNLGHSLRKQRHYNSALVNYAKALEFNPSCALTCAAQAFTYQLDGQYNLAIESYHKALAKNPGDPFSTKMLTEALRCVNRKVLREPQLNRQ